MEEFGLQIRSELEQIQKVLTKGELEKMPFQGIEIAKTLGRLPIFRRFFDINSQAFINMCINQDVIGFEERTQIYNKGEVEDERYMYLILEGQVVVNQTNRYGILSLFGQIQLLFGIEVRLSQVIAEAGCKLMRIKESQILKIFSRRDDLKKCLRFLNNNSYFLNLDQIEKFQLCLMLVKKSFEKGEVLKTKGANTQQVLYFIHGKVKVVSEIDENGKKKALLIDELDEMSSYGEYQSVSSLTTPLELIGDISGSYYILDIKQVPKHSKLKQIIEEHALPYPNHEQLLFLSKVKQTLKKEQVKVMKKNGYGH